MPDSAKPFSPRSWLFAPGDSPRKMEKAVASEADIALIDLEDSVAPDMKAPARSKVHDFLTAQADCKRVWVRINPLSGPDAALDLDAIMPAAPGGIFLPKAEGPADIDALDRLLTAREQAHGIAVGSTLVAALVTETPRAMFTTGEYAGAPRLVGLSWGAEDLSSALGANTQYWPDGRLMPTYELARSLCLLGAVAANALPIETVMPDFRDLDGLKARAQMVASQGYRSMLAIHPAQVAVINEAFTPSESAIAEARAIVQAFADNPDKGTIAIDGKMFDRPHLDLAHSLLARAR